MTTHTHTDYHYRGWIYEGTTHTHAEWLHQWWPFLTLLPIAPLVGLLVLVGHLA